MQPSHPWYTQSPSVSEILLTSLGFADCIVCRESVHPREHPGGLDNPVRSPPEDTFPRIAYLD